MSKKINKISELKVEKAKLRKLGKDQVEEIKKSFDLVKKEGRYTLINKVLIPVGAAVIAGYGIKKLIDAFQSDDKETVQEMTPPQYEGDPPIYHRTSAPENNDNNGIFSNVNWAAMAVRVAPFILSVGKKMYEEGNLPFFDPPSEEEG